MSFGGRGRGGFHNNHNNSNRNNNNNTNPNTVLFGGGPGGGVQVEIMGWNGASASECISFISRKCKVNVTNYSVDTVLGALRGSVRSEKDATDLIQWSGVRFAGNSLKLSRAGGSASGNGKPGQTGGDNTLEMLAAFLRSRYNPELKLLNLSAVHQDAQLASKGFFANMSTTSKFFPALMKVADKLDLDITSADLSGNNLTDLHTISTLAHTFPTLKNLSLQGNNISRVRAFDVWKKNLNFLRELLLHGNPLLNTTRPDEILNIKLELMKNFPRLVVLNGEVLRNEQALAQMMRFPFGLPQPMFFLDPDVQGVSTNFISNFTKMWDEDRAGLMVLYQNESQFSLQVDTMLPHGTTSNPLPDFGYYIPLSRNLMRVSTSKARMSKVAAGPEHIFRLFSQMPKTRHDLMTKPQNYSMEAYKIAQLGAISITLHGNFEEVAPPLDLLHLNGSGSGSGGGGRGKYSYNNKKNKFPLGWKSFDRSLVVIPGPNNSMIVASDLLCVRTETEADAFKPSETSPSAAVPTPAATAVPSVVPGAVPASSPSPAPVGGVAPVAVGPTAADLPPELKTSLNPQQQELLVKVLVETKLSIQYGFMLCQQSNWDYQQCIINFKNSASSLPPDAFAQ